MAKFCSLFSSSSGNATYVSTAKSAILIDAGVSAKRLKESLTNRGIFPASISAVFVTHEHSDHIKGLRVFCSQFNIPVYATGGTLKALEEDGVLSGKFPFYQVDENGVEIGDMLVKSFETPHDSNESAGYKIFLPDERKLAVATDMGYVTDTVKENLIGCDLVMLESNHDVGMVQNGDYPYYLKRRILSDRGHLSNIACSLFAKELIESGTTRLFLGHLSRENNMPQLAYETTYAAIYETGAVIGKDYLLSVNSEENKEDVVRF